MKKYFIFLIVLVCAIAAYAAEPAKGTAVLSGSATELTPLVVTANKSVKAYMWIEIQEEQDFAALEADLYLPEGVEVVGGKESTLTTGLDEYDEQVATHTVATSSKDGYYKIQISNATKILFSGKKGSVAQINLRVAASFEGGMAQFKNVIFGCASSPNPFDSTKGVDCDLFPIKETNHPAPQSKNAVAIKIDDKKSSQDGYYTFRATIEEPEDGDAEGYIMLLSKDAEPDTNPADGVTYVEGDKVGNSTVYASSGTVYNLSGLESGVYYAKAFAYKTGAQGPNYLIEGAPMASVTTPKAGTTAPESLWVRSTAATSIGLGVKGNAAGQKIIVAACDSTYNPGNYGTRPYPGNLSATSNKNDLIRDENGKQVGKVVYVGVPTPGSGTTFTVSSLKASTPYYFVAYASDGEQLAWDPDFVQVWATTEITAPYTVALNKAPENNQPVGWISEPGGDHKGFYVQKAIIGGGTQSTVLQGTNTGFNDYDWTASLTSPEVTLNGNCIYKYTFKWRMDEKKGVGHGSEKWAKEGEYLKFEVICNGVTTLAKNYTYENAPECLANKEWVNEVIDLSAYSGNKVQVRMTWRCEFLDGVDMLLDSLAFVEYSVDEAMLITAFQDPSTPENYYSTFYSSTTAYQVPEGVTVYTAKVKDSASEPNVPVLKLTSMADGIIPAGVGVILRASTKKIILTQTDEKGTATDENVLTGTDSEISSASEGIQALSLGENGVGFYPWAGMPIGAHKAYIPAATQK